MSLRIFLCCSVILGAVPPLSADIFTGGTTTTGSVAFQYAWDNCSYSAALCPTGGTTPVSVEVPFSFQISLPSTPESALTVRYTRPQFAVRLRACHHHERDLHAGYRSASEPIFEMYSSCYRMP
jgi:hypothetical protein